MKKYTANGFSWRFYSQISSWCYCRENFAEHFEKLRSSGAFLESGPGEKIWQTKSKYVLKIPVEEGFHVVYKGYRRISKVMSYLLRPSPCGLEAGNYQRIAALGITVPEFLAAGEERRFFVLKNAFCVTCFAEGFKDGRAFFEGRECAGEPQLKEEFLRRHLLLLARCHDAGIYHRGFTPANTMWKKRPGPDAEGNVLDLLWIDLASCRKVPFGPPARSCARDIAMFLKPFALPAAQQELLIELYCDARQKKAPRGKTLKALIG